MEVSVRYCGCYGIVVFKNGGLIIKKYTKDFLISEIKRARNELKRIPIQSDMCSKNGYPTVKPYVTIFGSWNNLLKELDWELNEISIYTDDELLNEIDRFVETNGRIPLIRDIGNKNGYPGYTTYINHFGSLNNAIKQAGYITNSHYTKEYLLNELIRYYDEYNKSPKVKDMNSTNGYPSGYTYIKAFGSFTTALQLVNLEPNSIIHKYDGTETCTICNTSTSLPWRYYEGNLICHTCSSIIWNKENPEKRSIIKHRNEYKRREYNATPLNDYFYGSHAHHLHLENRTDFEIYIPYYLHKLHYHNSNKPETMITINAISLDWWINEDLYIEMMKEMLI